MTPPEHRTEAFVVRVWLEQREIAGALPEWRGVIEHVTSGKRQYILELDTIILFMAEYMHDWGVKPPSWVLFAKKIQRLILRYFMPHHLCKRR